MNSTSTIPWLPTTSEVEAAEVSLAEQVGMMLHQERQVLVIATGRDPGRLSGFLADLTHVLSHGESVLRIKAAIDATELYPLLAGQLGVPAHLAVGTAAAVQVGERLDAPARNGNYVLLCEGAHLYSDALLETIRQLSNYPINIVLCGRSLLLRRLHRGRLRGLRQRINYRLSLDEPSVFTNLKWPAAAVSLGLLLYLGLRITAPESEATPPASVAPVPPMVEKIRPATQPLAPALVEVTPPPEGLPTVIPPPALVPGAQVAVATAPADEGLALRWEPGLKQAPRR